MSPPPPAVIRPFQPGDQDQARALILRGLAEHWGWLDETLNPDLDDIAASYAGGLFLVACRGEQLVGTGVVLPRGEAAVIARMSVAAAERRRGLGGHILARLEAQARAWGCRRLELETTACWQDAVGFYLSQGYRAVEARDGDQYFEKEIGREDL